MQPVPMAHVGIMASCVIDNDYGLLAISLTPL